MSSISIRKPEFRLLLGYPDVILTRVGSEEPVGTAAPGCESFGADLRRLAGVVLRAGGRLTVVLPASEVWRGQVEPGGRAPRAEWRTARDRAAAALGVPPDSIRTVVGGRPARGGPVPAAAVRHSTLVEVRALLASVGLKPAAIVGAGAFEGFATPPRLGRRWAPPAVGRRRALAGAGGLAAAVVALMVMGLRPDTATVVPVVATAPAPVAVAAAPAIAASATAVAAVAPAPVVAKAPAPVRVARADPPPARPQPAPLLPAAIETAPMATLATRSVSMTMAEEGGKPVARIRLAELSDPSGPLTDVAVPLPRPGKAAAVASAGALGPVLSLRPEPRPIAAPAAEAPARADVGGDRPMPRPGAPAKPVRVASLGNQVSDAVIAAAVLTPLARPASLAVAAAPAAPKVVPKPAAVTPVAPKMAAAPLAPKPVVTPPRVVAPAPKVVAAATPVTKPAPQPVAAPQRVVRVEERRPAPTVPTVRVAATPQAPKPVPVQKPVPVRVAVAAPVEATETVRRPSAAAGFFGFGGGGRSRSDMTLVGIFGGGDGRSALVQMPNGKIQKVSAGDRVQGMQVAAIGADSVRMTDGRRETVLAMPD